VVGSGLDTPVASDLTLPKMLLTKLRTEAMGWKGLEDIVLRGLVSEIKLLAVGRNCERLNGSRPVLAAGISENRDLAALAILFKLDRGVLVGFNSDLKAESCESNDCGRADELGRGSRDGNGANKIFPVLFEAGRPRD
jgi:hypothetical protein